MRIPIFSRDRNRHLSRAIRHLGDVAKGAIVAELTAQGFSVGGRIDLTPYLNGWGESPISKSLAELVFNKLISRNPWLKGNIYVSRDSPSGNVAGTSGASLIGRQGTRIALHIHNTPRATAILNRLRVMCIGSGMIINTSNDSATDVAEGGSLPITHVSMRFRSTSETAYHSPSDTVSGCYRDLKSSVLQAQNASKMIAYIEALLPHLVIKGSITPSWRYEIGGIKIQHAADASESI